MGRSMDEGLLAYNREKKRVLTPRIILEVVGAGGGGRTSAASSRHTRSPQILMKGKAQGIMLDAIIKMWVEYHPDEVVIFQGACKDKRENLIHANGLSKGGNLMLDALVPQRVGILILQLMPELYESNELGREFAKHFAAFCIKDARARRGMERRRCQNPGSAARGGRLHLP